MTRTPSPTEESPPGPPSPSSPPPRTLELHEMSIKKLESQLSEVPKQQTKKRSWEELLGGNICIGEIHWDVAPKKFLIQNMPLFGKSEFRVLFLEHLSVKEHSELLDQYFATGEMSEVLKTKLSALDEGHKLPLADEEKSEEWSNYNFTEIVKAARQNGIKVIPLEESEKSWRQLKGGGAIRSAVFSLNAKEVIDKHVESNVGSKWLALVGSSHLNTYQGIPGICEIVQGAQDLLITDFDRYNKGHSQSLEVHLASTDIKWTAEKEEDPLSECIKASMSLIIDYRSDMSYEAIPANESLRAFAGNRSGSSSGSAAAAEDLRGKRGQEQRTETGGFSLLDKRPAKTIRMPQTTENKSQESGKLSEEGNGENKGR